MNNTSFEIVAGVLALMIFNDENEIEPEKIASSASEWTEWGNRSLLHKIYMTDNAERDNEAVLLMKEALDEQ